VKVDGLGTLNVGGNNASSTFFGGMSGSLTKTGSGILTLTGSSTYSGGTTISAGTLAVTNAASLGAAGGALSIGPTTLEVEGNFSDARNVSLTDRGSTIQVDPSFTYGNSGTLSGARGLTLSGGGLLVLSGSNSYSGGTFVDAGTLVVNNSEALPDGSSLIVGSAASLAFGIAISAAPAAGNAQAVPEPSTSALIAAGILLAACYRRWARGERGG